MGKHSLISNLILYFILNILPAFFSLPFPVS